MGSGDEFSVVVERDGRGSVVRIIGELDMATAPQLQECLRDLEGTTVTLDFSGVTFMDSGGIAVLASAMKRASERSAELRLRGVRPAQMRILEITGMADQLTFDT
jgi:anti-sigma B factor antagonist